MPTATCHCGAVRVTVPRNPPAVTNCGCSICRRYGALWAYYRASTVRIKAGPKTTRAYAWGRKTIRFVRCATCGCVMCWQRVLPRPERKMGVKARNFDPEVLRSVRRRHADRMAGDINLCRINRSLDGRIADVRPSTSSEFVNL